jgi:AraC-like DNA-binding protein
MYVWKVWFRVTDPLPGLPVLRTLQCHTYRNAGWRISADPATAEWRILVVVDGVFSLWTDGARRALHPGEALAYPVARPPVFGVARDGEAGTFLFAGLEGACLDAILPPLIPAEGVLPIDLTAPGMTQLTAWRAIYERMVATNPGRAGATPTPDLGGAESMRLATGLIATLAESRGLVDPRAGIARRATELVRVAVRFDLDVASLARQIGCSRQHLSEAFRSAGLPPPSTWLAQRRMAEARRLLDEDLPVAEVAYRLGYASDATLARAYRRLTGRAPRRG